MRSGIFRKLDDVGRIVIPKEIRKYLKIADGSSLEIGINDSGEVVIRASRVEDETVEKINQIGENLHKILNKVIVFVVDLKVLKSFGKNISGEISASLINIINANQSYFACKKDKTTLIPIIKDIEICYGNIAVVPIKNLKHACIISIGEGDDIEVHEVKFLEFVTKLIEV